MNEVGELVEDQGQAFPATGEKPQAFLPGGESPGLEEWLPEEFAHRPGKTFQLIAVVGALGKEIAKILPGIVRTMSGEVGVSSVRDIELEDLLGREPVETDLASISAYVSNRVVLVTGAGGSIGSELCMQLSALEPKLLLLLDNDETSLYELELELLRVMAACPFQAVVADVRDEKRVESVFRRHRPQVVFHSAALKHVPMMEYHPAEAVKNNVLGTRVVAEASLRHGAERFILISTDKAVHPVNVMGATKRVAEMLVKDYSGRDGGGREGTAGGASGGGGGTLFTAVRFGNVLGSRGSVVPTFQRQIEKGGPVMVTHPEVTRYFMTVGEAAQLVIQAGAFTRGGDLFILDMGEPVKIIDLAREMLRLTGKEGEIEVKVTGLRTGEKLHEELTFPEEELARTPHPKIDKVVHDLEFPEDFAARVEELIQAAARDDEERVCLLLSELVPTYKPPPPPSRPSEPGGSGWRGKGRKGHIFNLRDTHTIETRTTGKRGQVLNLITIWVLAWKTVCAAGLVS